MTKLENKLRDILDSLRDDKHPDYPFKIIPCELDDEVSYFISMYKKLSVEERETVYALTSESHSCTLLAFAERMAALGVRERSRERLLDGLLSLIIENYYADWRDNLTKLAPLYNSAVKIGVDPRRLFSEAASYRNNEVSQVIRDFPERDPEDRSLKAFGYEESLELDGFRYKWI